MTRIAWLFVFASWVCATEALLKRRVLLVLPFKPEDKSVNAALIRDKLSTHLQPVLLGRSLMVVVHGSTADGASCCVNVLGDTELEFMAMWYVVHHIYSVARGTARRRANFLRYSQVHVAPDAALVHLAAGGKDVIGWCPACAFADPEQRCPRHQVRSAQILEVDKALPRLQIEVERDVCLHCSASCVRRAHQVRPFFACFFQV